MGACSRSMWATSSWPFLVPPLSSPTMPNGRVLQPWPCENIARRSVKSGRSSAARTGINSGRMLVGNLGSKYRFAYGVLGDPVNLGSRLEGLNKAYGTEILLGETTAQLVEKAFVLREIDLVRVVGRDQPVRIYELLARSGTALPKEQEEAL